MNRMSKEGELSKLMNKLNIAKGRQVGKGIEGSRQEYRLFVERVSFVFGCIILIQYRKQK